MTALAPGTDPSKTYPAVHLAGVRTILNNAHPPHGRRWALLHKSTYWKPVSGGGCELKQGYWLRDNGLGTQR